MRCVLITGSAGLIGSESCKRFHEEGFDVIGIDNDMRAVFFGGEASTSSKRRELQKTYQNYTHYNVDIRDADEVEKLVRRHKPDLIIHTAAQPSHDWAAKNPRLDFAVNATGTLNMLEAARLFCPESPFIFTSTNKVYGDTPNKEHLTETDTRFELQSSNFWTDEVVLSDGFDEAMSIDHTKHSVFGASKVAADVMVQEYGRYFGMPTVCFRGGCLTGPSHAGTELHGFLSYLMKCTVEGKKYKVFGYKGKQVRDNIHSADLVEAFMEFYKAPKNGAVYNLGGSRHSNCSMLEAIEMCQNISGKKLDWEYIDENRIGDHKWWISDVRKFQKHYPKWKYQYGLEDILQEIHNSLV